MAKVIIYCLQPLDPFEKRILILQENVSIRIGRPHSYETISEDNALFTVITPLISYKHAFFTYKNGKVYIKDCSRNGTFVNGHRLNKEDNTVILSGDIVQLARDAVLSSVNVTGLTLVIKLIDVEDLNYMKLLRRDYPFPVQLYEFLPNFEYSLESFYECTRERLEVLQILDSFGNFEFNKGRIVDTFLSILKKKSLFNFYSLVIGSSKSFQEEYNLQQMDYVSHYILCMACCRNFVMRRWFEEQESKLLFIRWRFLILVDKREFLTKQFPHYQLIGDSEKKLIVDLSDEQMISYYRVPFQHISQLLRSRQVLMRNGVCFVSIDDIVFAVQTYFTKLIYSRMLEMKKNLNKVWLDERIAALIPYVERQVQFERFLFSEKSSSVLLKELNVLVNECFPLCMNILHYNLKKNNHLKNGGRFQFGLFLKAIGLSLTDSLTFWRYYFTKKMSVVDFMKNYNYHVLHMYGAAGKRADYPPQSCKKILKATPAYGEYHGCPFKILDEDNLTVVLKRNGIKPEGISEVINITKEGMPQMACTKYFEFKHRIQVEEAVYHPNVYFEESRKMFDQKRFSNENNESNQNDISRNAKKLKISNCKCYNEKLEW